MMFEMTVVLRPSVISLAPISGVMSATTPAWRRYLRFWGADPAADVNDEFAFHIQTRIDELNDALAAIDVEAGDFHQGSAHPVEFPERRGWHVVSSGLTPRYAQGEYVQTAAATIPYGDGPNALPPDRTLGALPEEGILVWVSLVRDARFPPLRWGRGDDDAFEQRVALKVLGRSPVDRQPEGRRATRTKRHRVPRATRPRCEATRFVASVIGLEACAATGSVGADAPPAADRARSRSFSSRAAGKFGFEKSRASICGSLRSKVGA